MWFGLNCETRKEFYQNEIWKIVRYYITIHRQIASRDK